MNKREFNELISYLQNRPEECKRLEAVLSSALPLKGDIHEAEGERWMTASEVGQELGRSHQWVKDKDGVLPLSARRISPTGRRTRLYLWNLNTRHLFEQQL